MLHACFYSIELRQGLRSSKFCERKHTTFIDLFLTWPVLPCDPGAVISFLFLNLSLAEIVDRFIGLIRFIPRSGSQVIIGQPTDAHQDVGLAARKQEEIQAEVYDGLSILEPGKPTGKFELVDRLLSPLNMSEVGSIRCIGLNVRVVIFYGI